MPTCPPSMRCTARVMVPSYSHHISWSMTWTGYLCATGFTVDSRRLTDFSVPLKILSLTKADALLLPHVVSEQSLRLDCVEHHRHRLHLCHCPPSRTSFRTSTTWGRWTPTCTTRPAWTRSISWGRLLRKRNTTLYISILPRLLPHATACVCVHGRFRFIKHKLKHFSDEVVVYRDGESVGTQQRRGCVYTLSPWCVTLDRHPCHVTNDRGPPM